MTERSELRRKLRASRAALPAGLRARAAQRVAVHLLRLRSLRPGARVAVYLATGSELPTAPLIAALLRRGCIVAAPRIRSARNAAMDFVVVSSARLRRNALGLLEPRDGPRVGARWLNVVLLPLLAFDARGARLGSGRGYYDRAFAFRRQRRHWRGPLLLGIGFAAQELPNIELQAHDVRLDGVVTERQLRRFTPYNAPP
ncbi:MAG: 5-formyltetrahydrofolate cyclo-ligase [Steroidobacteraceae bacterium]|nr:5-formyltetrahydrofolate cyclo-ligase [Steroidobacteraceae bacterium]MDW8257956.1 5-formyltetrahydrofolate cyclo-ligase [Gammaproteobacteria bacterium]